MIRQAAIVLLSAVTILCGCEGLGERDFDEIPAGVWRGVIFQQGKELPFNFDLLKEGTEYTMVIRNGEERIEVNEITVTGDTMRVVMPIFDSEFNVILKGDKLVGSFQKNYAKDYVLPFEAVYDCSRRFIEDCREPAIDISGRWSTKFKKKDGSEYVAVGKFTQKGHQVLGTFLTTTGDYRYLEGHIKDDLLQLSCFDGNHLFLFEGHIAGDSIVNGEFWHGTSTYETWNAGKDWDASLPSAYDLTYLKPGYDSFEFSFPDLQGNTVSLEDDIFKGKVVIAQIFGTWCPNCMDETIFYADWYKKNKDRGVEIVGLAYEQKPDFEYAKSRVEKMKRKLNVDYKFLIAGTSDKEEAAKTLPMLNHVLSFPTSIFIDRKGQVRKIHTGFTGPGTGEDYTQFIKEFEEITEELIGEGEVAVAGLE